MVPVGDGWLQWGAGGWMVGAYAGDLQTAFVGVLVASPRGESDA